MYAFNAGLDYMGSGFMTAGYAPYMSMTQGCCPTAQSAMGSMIWGAQKGLSEYRLPSILNKLQTLKSYLENAIGSAPNNYKDKLREQLNKVNELLRLHQSRAMAIVSATSSDPNGAIRLVESYEKIVSSLYESVQRTFTEMQEAQQTSDDDSSSGDVSGSDETSESGDKTPQKEHDEIVESLSTVCDALKTAMQGAGTDWDGVDANGAPTGIYNILTNDAIINENNIIELFERWETQCANVGDFADDKGGLIESLMDDCEGQQKEQIAGRIIDLLEKRAKKYKLDVSSEVQAARQAAAGKRDWHTCWMGRWRDDDDIVNAVKALYDKVKAESDKHIKEEGEKADKTKKENEEKTEQKDKEALETFKQDMREIYDDENLEISDKVKCENGVFKIRILGYDCSGTSFRALVDDIESHRDEDGEKLNAKKYICKKRLNETA